MTIKWNIVNRSGQPSDAIARKLRPKITKLEKLLTHFPQDAVHLQIILDSRPSDKAHIVALNLRVPSDVLHVSKESKNLVTALDDGVNTLIRRLKRLKARYRRDYAWKHRRGKTIPERGFAFAESPLPVDEGPQTETDAVAEVLREDYGRLLGFVTRQLNEYILTGVIPKGAIDPVDIVDRVAEQVLGCPELKPESMDYRTWCSTTAFQQTRDGVRRYAEEMGITVPVDLDITPEPAPAGDDDLEPEEFALNMLQNQLEPDESTLADVIPDPQAEPPDLAVERDELLSGLSQICRQWPKVERETFQLHFLEGLSVDDLAHAFSCDRSSVEAAVSRVRGRLRTLLSETFGLQETFQPSREAKASYAQHLRTIAASTETH
jgi:ribosomal subunit interface protein